MLKGKLIDKSKEISPFRHCESIEGIYDCSSKENINKSSELIVVEDVISDTSSAKKMNNKIFLFMRKVHQMMRKMFPIMNVRDIVFLAIISAVMILTCGIMPLVVELTKVVFGIAQLVTGLQIALFTTIGLMKVRKPFALTLMLIFMGAIMVMMAPVMFLSNMFVAVSIELIILILFRGYRSDTACFVAGMLTGPFSLPIYMIYNYLTAPEIFSIITGNPYIISGVTVAIIAVSALGALLGVKIGRELQKAGVLKKNGKI